MKKLMRCFISWIGRTHVTAKRVVELFRTMLSSSGTYGRKKERESVHLRKNWAPNRQHAWYLLNSVVLRSTILILFKLR